MLAALRSGDPELIAKYSDLIIPDMDKKLLALSAKIHEAQFNMHLYVNKFDCFQKMLNHLVGQHGCIIKSKQLQKLPHLARCKKHLLTNDGSPRCIAVIEILVESKTFYILEVDTSDAINALSTQILLLNLPEDWSKQLIEIESALIKNLWYGQIICLRDTAERVILKEFCTQNHPFLIWDCLTLN